MMATKRLNFTRTALACALLPVVVTGCSNVDRLINDEDYIDYKTDHLRASQQPVVAVTTPGFDPPAAQSPIAIETSAPQATADLYEPSLAAAIPLPILTNDALDESQRFGVGRNVYASAGIGASMLRPNTSAVDGVSVEDKFSEGGHVSVGMDVNKHLSLELQAADLGQAGLGTTGDITYQLGGLSALFYAGGDRNNRSRRGITGFARVGLSYLENEGSGDLVIERKNDTQLLFGGGLEYNTRTGFGLRAELISFDADAQYGQLGLMYRFGSKKNPVEIAATAKPTPVNSIEPLMDLKPPEPESDAPVALAAVQPLDADNDGVFDSEDLCAGTRNGLLVNHNGCELFSGTLDGVTFHSNSAVLTDEGIDVLRSVSHSLRKYKDAKILVTSHTDNRGGANHNQRLSENRARSVVAYLARTGIPYSRMRAKAYGERKPVDTNATAAGRAANRRVELIATQRTIR